MTLLESGPDVLGQRLRAAVQVAGTDFHLAYGSDRVPGNHVGHRMLFPLSGETVPDPLKRIDVAVEVAGNRYTASYPGEPNQVHTLHWDGTDAYGTLVDGAQPVDYQIGFVYDGVYTDPDAGPSRPGAGGRASSFGRGSDVAIEGNRSREEITLWRTVDGRASGVYVSHQDARTRGFGGWTLSPHHRFDPVSRTLAMGDGTQRSIGEGASGVEVEEVAGIDPDARLQGPTGAAVGPDGSVYVADQGQWAVRRLRPDGIAETVAGIPIVDGRGQSASSGIAGDGGDATEATVGDPTKVAVADDGTIFVSQHDFHVIRRIRPNGVIDTVAGTGDPGYEGDGGPAEAARLNAPVGVAIGPDGDLYICDEDNHAIRRVDSDGTITTVAGIGESGYEGDGGPATEASLNEPSSIAVADDGTIYVCDAENDVVRRIGSDGRIETIAGTGAAGYDGDGGPATEATLDEPNGIDLGPDGSVYVAASLNQAIRRIRPDGIIETVAGTGERGYTGTDGPATEATFNIPIGVAIAEDGTVYVVDRSNNALRRIDSQGTMGYAMGAPEPTRDGNEYVLFGYRGYTGDGGPATWAALTRPEDVDVDDEGNVYILDVDVGVVRRVDVGGTIETVAGTPLQQVTGEGNRAEGVDATTATIGRASAVAAGDGRAFYLADGFGRIRRVSPQGTIRTVAGGGETDPDRESLIGGDDPVATDVRLRNTTGLDVGSDGTVYVAGYRRVRAVGPDGRIRTVAGGGSADPDGVVATDARLSRIVDVSADPTGGFYLATDQRVFRVRSDGQIVAYAGTAEGGPGGPDDVDADTDGPALEASFGDISGIELDQSGAVYVVDELARDLRVIGPDGIVTTVLNEDLTPPGTIPPESPRGVAVGPDSSVYFADPGLALVRRVPRVAGDYRTRYVIPSVGGNMTYEFDSTGQHLRTRNVLTGEVILRFEYEDLHLVAVVDGHGNETTIERADDGRLRAIVSPDGHRTGVEHDANGYLSQVGAPTGESVTAAYTDGGLLTSLVDGNNEERTAEYGRIGRLERYRNPDGDELTIERQEWVEAVEIRATAPSGRVGSYTVETRDDGSVLLTDELRSRRVTIDPGGDTSIVEEPGIRTTTTFAPDPRFGWLAPYPATSVTESGGSELQVASDRRATLSDPDDVGTLEQLTARRTVDGGTDVHRYTVEDRTIRTTTAGGQERVMPLTSNGSVVRAGIVGLAPTTYTYDDRGRPTETVSGDGAIAQRTAIEWGEDGYVAGVRDALDNTIAFESDALGRQTKVIMPDGRGVEFDYDGNGNVTSMTPPGRPATTFTYTGTGNVATVAPAGGDPIAYEYDGDGFLTGVRFPDGQTYGATYDDRGRLVTAELPSGTVTYSYDGEARRFAGGTAENDAGLVSLSVGYSGTHAERIELVGPVAGTVEEALGTGLRLAGRSVGGTTVEYEYDADRLLVGAGTMSIDRSATGLIDGTELGDVRERWTHDDLGQVRSYEATAGGGTLLQATYECDARGLVTRIDGRVDGDRLDRIYEYDSTGRLTTVRDGGSVVEEYAYDENDNRVRATRTGEIVEARYDEADRLVQLGDREYAYDGAGRLASVTDGTGTTTFDYDVRGDLRAVDVTGGPTVEYLVDPFGRRVGKLVDGSLQRGWLYGSERYPVAEVDDAGRVVAHYVYGTFEHVPDYVIREGKAYKILADHRGSPRLVVDADDGTVIQRLDYDAFGRVVRDTNPGFQPFGFAGGLYDPDTGLVRFGVRDYDPEAGRWTAPDPQGVEGSFTNPYVYVGNNPVSVVDPTGAVPTVVVGCGVGALIGGGVNAGLQYSSTGDVDWGNVGIAAGGGCAAGALGPLAGGSTLGMIAIGAGTSGVEQLGHNAYDRSQGKCVSITHGLGAATLLGGAFSGVGKYAGDHLDDALYRAKVDKSRLEMIEDFGEIATGKRTPMPTQGPARRISSAERSKKMLPVAETFSKETAQGEIVGDGGEGKAGAGRQ